MSLIRTEDGDIIWMIPVLCQYGLKRCNVVGCRNKPTTIDTDSAPRPYALCEEHYQQFLKESKEKGKAEIHLEWNNFDAFAASEKAKEA